MPGIDVVVVRRAGAGFLLVATPGMGAQADTGEEMEFASVTDKEPPGMGMVVIIAPLPIGP